MDMYAATVPVFDRMLINMQTWIRTARDHAIAKGFDESVYLTLRLAPDMLPLPRQIQIASDAAKSGAARLASIEVPSWPDDEATLDDLIQRMQKTRDFLKTVTPEQINGSEARAISVPRRSKEPLQFEGQDFVRFYNLPNFFFHATTLYALLRNAGVPLGKMDFLGQPK
ncbi:DUF1993 domain-containing protein [Mitsuaria sp. CC2]|jgi:uncharacterized protein|uniref:DUF1993 domain-containing protein n=1 Tax=Mitsuaria sp. CC2 TaxID=3029186 RepID=UPI003B8B3816